MYYEQEHVCVCAAVFSQELKGTDDKRSREEERKAREKAMLLGALQNMTQRFPVLLLLLFGRSKTKAQTGDQARFWGVVFPFSERFFWVYPVFLSDRQSAASGVACNCLLGSP